MDTDSLIIHVTTDDIYKDIAKDVETKFDTSNYVLYRPLLKEKKFKKVIWLTTDKLGGKITKTKRKDTKLFHKKKSKFWRL